MIFIYPAAISANVDERYLPGLIKTVELYYLNHIVESVASGSIRFYIKRNAITGRYSDIMLEANDYSTKCFGSDNVMFENACKYLEEAGSVDKTTDLKRTLDNNIDLKTKLDEERKDLHEKKTQLEKDKLVHTELIQKLNQEINNIDTTLSDLDQKINNLESNVRILETEFRKFRDEANDKIRKERKEIKDEEINLQRIDRAINAQRRSPTDSELDAMQEVRDSIVEYEQNITNLENEIKAKESELETAKTELRNLINERRDLQRSRSDIEKQIKEQGRLRNDELIRDIDKKLRDNENTTTTINKTIEDLTNKIEEEKFKEGQAGGVSGLRWDTTQSFDLRPTAITVSASVLVEKKKGAIPFIGTETTVDKRDIPIGVKVLPIRLKNVDDMKNLMLNDSATNMFAVAFKSIFRSALGKVFKWFNPALKVFFRHFTNKDDSFDVWRDMIFNKKSVINASSVGFGEAHPSYQKYSAAMIVLSSNDLKSNEINFVTNPRVLSKLHMLGWNTVSVLNDPDQVLHFCSYFENGMCTKIPYSYIFHSMKSTDLFKDLDSLSRFTNKVVGRFKFTPKSISKSIKENTEKQIDKVNKYKKVLNDGLE